MQKWEARTPELNLTLTMAKQLPAFALLLWALPALLHASSPRDPYQFFFDQSLGDLTEELEIAQANLAAGLPVIINIKDN